ncbi:MAG: MATE family efflux transporter [Muribaculaceae bacterium]|nr:MATE family efflux transporter [Muribaculaceae bacterium]
MQAPLRRQIFSIAVPAVIANLTTPLLGLIDLAIVGHLGNEIYIAAIALGGSVFSMLYWIFAFLRMGTSGTTAQAYGAADPVRLGACFYRPLIISLAISAVILALQAPLGDLLINFVADGDSASAPARIYYNLLIYGAPATLGMYVISGYLIGCQNSRASMWVSLLINVVNIVASLLTVYCFGMEIKGVALGSLIAQWTGFLVGLLYIISHYTPACQRLKQLFNASALKSFFTLNGNIFIRTVCLVTVTVWFTRAGASQGARILAANALLMQLFSLFTYFMDGFAYASEAIVGKYIGQRDAATVRLTISQSLKIALWLSVAFTIIYFLLGNEIIAMLTSETEVRAVAADYRWWTVTIPLVSFGAFVYDGVFIGATKSSYMLATMIFATIAFFATWFGLRGLIGNHALWLAFILYLLTRSIASHLLAPRLTRRG